jgi:2-dehydro-3-deoxygluconokinase
MTRILCIGEAMAEIRRDGEGFAVGFAGDTFNTAVYCRRTLRTGSVGYLTRIGKEPLSEGFLSLATREALDTSMIRRETEHNIGIYSVQTDAAGERSFAYWRANSAARQLFQHPEDFAALGQADLLYLSGITLAILAPEARAALLDHLAKLRQAGKRVAFDSNYRPKLWPDAATARRIIAQAWALTDIALPSVDDEMALFDEPDAAAVLQRLRDLGLREGALKRGAEGPVALDANVTSPTFAPAARVVDTTAAGDSFNGGFLAACVDGADTAASMLAGHNLARIVVSRPGAIVDTTLD